MISEFATTRELPEEARKPYRHFLVGYCLSVVLLAVLFVVAYYRHIAEIGDQSIVGVATAFLGLVMTAMVGGSAVRCIHAVARASRGNGQSERSGDRAAVRDEGPHAVRE